MQKNDPWQPADAQWASCTEVRASHWLWLLISARRIFPGWTTEYIYSHLGRLGYLGYLGYLLICVLAERCKNYPESVSDRLHKGNNSIFLPLDLGRFELWSVSSLVGVKHELMMIQTSGDLAGPLLCLQRLVRISPICQNPPESPPPPKQLRTSEKNLLFCFYFCLCASFK